MLKKLLKYDFLASVRYLWMAWVALLGAATVSGLSTRLQSDSSYAGLAMVLTTMLILLLLLAVWVLTLVQVILRFHTNLLKDEGYLMHTLPVHTWQLVLSKLLCGTAVLLLSALASALAAGVWAFCSNAIWDYGNAFQRIGAVFRFYGVYFDGWTTILLCCTWLVSAVSLILNCYAALSLGQLANRNRILFAFLWFLGIRTAVKLLNTMITIVTGLVSNAGMGVTNTNGVTFFMNTSSLTQLIVKVLVGIACFVITEEVLKRKLNLQ